MHQALSHLVFEEEVRVTEGCGRRPMSLLAACLLDEGLNLRRKAWRGYIAA